MMATVHIDRIIVKASMTIFDSVIVPANPKKHRNKITTKKAIKVFIITVGKN